MAHKAPGKAYREGITLLQLADLFPTEESAVGWFEGVVWSGERACGHCGSLDTHRIKSGKPMPYRCRDCKRYFRREDGNAHGRIAASRPQVGVCDLLGLHEPQGCCLDEAAPGPRRHTEDRVVHAATHPRSVPCGRPHGLRRAGRSGRNLFRRSGEEQALLQEATGWTRNGGQDGGGRREGSGHKSSSGSGGRGHGQEDATGIREDSHGPRARSSTRTTRAPTTAWRTARR